MHAIGLDEYYLWDLVISDCGDLPAVMITPGNVDDRKPAPRLARRLSEKLFGDRGYISKELFQLLLGQGVQLITKIKEGMKNKLIPMLDKILLRKRALSETVNDQLKNICQIEHTRHRSVANVVVKLSKTHVLFANRPKQEKASSDEVVGWPCLQRSVRTNRPSDESDDTLPGLPPGVA
jgi:Transposase DDE domain